MQITALTILSYNLLFFKKSTSIFFAALCAALCIVEFSIYPDTCVRVCECPLSKESYFKSYIFNQQTFVLDTALHTLFIIYSAQ